MLTSHAFVATGLIWVIPTKYFFIFVLLSWWNEFPVPAIAVNWSQSQRSHQTRRQKLKRLEPTIVKNFLPISTHLQVILARIFERGQSSLQGRDQVVDCLPTDFPNSYILSSGCIFARTLYFRCNFFRVYSTLAESWKLILSVVFPLRKVGDSTRGVRGARLRVCCSYLSHRCGGAHMLRWLHRVSWGMKCGALEFKTHRLKLPCVRSFCEPPREPDRPSNPQIFHLNL